MFFKDFYLFTYAYLGISVEFGLKEQSVHKFSMNLCYM